MKLTFNTGLIYFFCFLLFFYISKIVYSAVLLPGAALVEDNGMVVVKNLKPKSKTAILGVQIDDIVIEINGQKIQSLHDYVLKQKSLNLQDTNTLRLARITNGCFTSYKVVLNDGKYNLDIFTLIPRTEDVAYSESKQKTEGSVVEAIPYPDDSRKQINDKGTKESEVEVYKNQEIINEKKVGNRDIPDKKGNNVSEHVKSINDNMLETNKTFDNKEEIGEIQTITEISRGTHTIEIFSSAKESETPRASNGRNLNTGTDNNIPAIQEQIDVKPVLPVKFPILQNKNIGLVKKWGIVLLISFAIFLVIKIYLGRLYHWITRQIQVVKTKAELAKKKRLEIIEAKRVKEMHANKKRLEIIEAINFVTTDLNNMRRPIVEQPDNIHINLREVLKTRYIDVLGESIIIGGGATGLTIIDIYQAVADHEEVLSALEYRFNREMGDASSMEWFSKITKLSHKGEGAINGYMNNYVGQAGEFAAVDFFKNQGLEAELFESRVHPGTDCRVSYPDGSQVDYSVKSYKNASDFNKFISDHPEAKHYIVNTETYSKLKESGKLSEYQDNGQVILDGEFSNYTDHEIGEEALEDIANAGSFSDDIPWLSYLLFSRKVVQNAKQLIQGRQSLREFGVNTTVDAVRIGAGGITAACGAKIGAGLGTFLCPGIGTIVGGGVGAIIGYAGGALFFDLIKEEFKWGNIIEAIDYLGQNYRNIFTCYIAEGIKYKILKKDEVEKRLYIEETLLEKYKDQLDPYKEARITLPAILCYLHCNVLKISLRKTDESVVKLRKTIYELCDKVATDLSEKYSKDKKMFKERLLGEIIAANSGMLPSSFRDNKIEMLISGYREQIKKCPNHPYRFAMDSKEILAGLAIKSMLEYPVDDLIEDLIEEQHYVL